MHEHTFNVSPEINQTYPETWGDEEQRVGDAVAMYRAAKEKGVDSVTDLTVIGLGRFIPRIRRIAEQVELNIVVPTGVYTWHELPMYFRFVGPPERSMEDMFVRDIEEGIGDSGVRAGIIKVATDKHRDRGRRRLPACVGPGPPPHRRADHHPHPRRPQRPGAAAGIRGRRGYCCCPRGRVLASKHMF